MNDLEINVLCILRSFGPCSNAEVGRRLKIPPDRTYRIVKSLELCGIAVHPKLQQWDISRLGRDMLERLDYGRPALTLFTGDAE